MNIEICKQWQLYILVFLKSVCQNNHGQNTHTSTMAKKSIYPQQNVQGIFKIPTAELFRVFKVLTAEFLGYSKYRQQNLQGVQNTHSRIYRVFKIPTVEFTGQSKYPQQNLQGIQNTQQNLQGIQNTHSRIYRVVKIPTVELNRVFKIPTVEFTGQSKYPQYN